MLERRYVTQPNVCTFLFLVGYQIYEGTIHLWRVTAFDSFVYVCMDQGSWTKPQKGKEFQCYSKAQRYLFHTRFSQHNYSQRLTLSHRHMYQPTISLKVLYVFNRCYASPYLCLVSLSYLSQFPNRISWLYIYNCIAWTHIYTSRHISRKSTQ